MYHLYNQFKVPVIDWMGIVLGKINKFCLKVYGCMGSHLCTKNIKHLCQ